MCNMYLFINIERFDLQQLADKRTAEIANSSQQTTPFHNKVSLFASGVLEGVAVDAVVNASNCWLTPGKGIVQLYH